YLAEAHDVEPEEISTEKLFDDVEQQLIAWDVMIDPQVTLDYFQKPPTLEQLQLRLQQLMGSTWSDVWKKSPPQQRNPKTQKKKKERTHHSVYRILAEHTRPRPKRKARSPSGKLYTAVVGGPGHNFVFAWSGRETRPQLCVRVVGSGDAATTVLAWSGRETRPQP
ncbi:MAG: hypothetical protein RIK87_10040, partial [Fuerstiella sp.]